VKHIEGGAESDDRHVLVRGAHELGLELSSEQVDLLLSYVDTLRRWNTRVNLISRRDTGRIVTHHLLDSLAVVPLVPGESEWSVVDVGTGAGLPGIPVKICRPSILLTMIESSRKRTLFLEHAISSLGLERARFVTERVQVWGMCEEVRGRYDMATARALGKIKVVLRLCMPLLKPGGILVMCKGVNIDGELSESEGALEREGGELVEVREVTLPFRRVKRQLVIIRRRV
jgi:16S rRNA (guanine527-N7)-methyltransferase